MMNLESNMQISGRVVKGDKYGRQLGFPTANLDRQDYARRKLKIKLGVWAGIADIVLSKRYQVSTYKAGIVIGPIDRQGLPKIEAHLIGFQGNLYHKKIKLYLNQYLRPFKTFKNINALKQQIKKDIKEVNIYYGA